MNRAGKKTWSLYKQLINSEQFLNSSKKYLHSIYFKRNEQEFDSQYKIGGSTAISIVNNYHAEEMLLFPCQNLDFFFQFCQYKRRIDFFSFVY